MSRARPLCLLILGCLAVAAGARHHENERRTQGTSELSKERTTHGNKLSEACTRQRHSTLPIQAGLLQAACTAAAAHGIALLAYTNRAGVNVFAPLFVGGLRLADRADRHLVLILQDASALDACLALHDTCVVDDWSTSSAQAPEANQVYNNILSKSFRAITWRKVELARDLVNQGISVMLVDVDTLFFRNPVPIVSALPPRDLYAAKEWLYEGSNAINCGAFSISATAAGRAVVERWLGMRARWDREDMLMNEQGALTELLKIQDANYTWGMLPPTAFASKCYLPWNSEEEGPPMWKISNVGVLGAQFVAAGAQHGWKDTLVMVHAACTPGNYKQAVLGQLWRDWHIGIATHSNE